MRLPFLLLATVLTLLGSTSRANESIDLLVAAQRAQATRAFEGVVVFMHDGKFDAVRVVHRPGQSGFEHVSSLSGMPRALFRDAREVRIEVPGGAQRLSPMVFAQTAFDAGRIGASYQLADAGSERIAGFIARIVDAVARDEHRYSQRMWISPESGVLLGVALIGPRRETLQQVMFTSLSVDAREQQAQALAALPLPTTDDDASIPSLPAGFRIIATRNERGRRSLIMSDGLAMITLYLETRGDDLDRMTTLRRGATQLAARQLGHERAVVVGEVPLSTAVELANRAVGAEKH